MLILFEGFTLPNYYYFQILSLNTHGGPRIHDHILGHVGSLMKIVSPQVYRATPYLVRYITQESHKLEIALKPPPAVTNAVSWRTEGVKYRKNEVFLDVIESVDLLAGASGNVLRSEIVGCIKMRVYLSGMPELRLGLNDKVLFESTGRGKSKSVELEDVKFHQCVRLSRYKARYKYHYCDELDLIKTSFSRFDNDRTISFIPPDGEFELMSYRLNTHVRLDPRGIIFTAQ